MSILLFDIGGTNLRMATGDQDQVLHIQKIPTPGDPHDAVAVLVVYAQERISDLSAACGGIASVTSEGIIFSSEHLPTWNGFNFKSALSEALAVPVSIANDAELAGLGEAIYGAGKEYSLVAYIGIGTGIGGSHIVNGAVVPHVEGFEPGHQILDVERGTTFEDLVSGYGLQKRFGRPAKELDRDVYDNLIPSLATGLYNVILEWSPEVLVLGGSLMNEENGYRIQDIEVALKSMSESVPVVPQLKRAMLGDDNGLYGALAFAKQLHI